MAKAVVANGQMDSSDTVYPTCLKSVNRLTKLPVVESTIQTASNLYGKVKDYNSLTNWTVSTAEGAMQKAVEVGKPIATPILQNLEGSIQKIDGVLCQSLDFVEDKVPAIKLQPNEMILQIYECTKDYVNNTVTPTVKPAIDYVEPAVTSAKNLIQPAVGKAFQAVEPTIEKAKLYVEPLVQPAIDKVHNITEDMKHKVEEFLWPHNHEDGEIECAECQKVREQAEQKKKVEEQAESEQQEQDQQEQQPENEAPQEDQHEENQQQ